MLSDRLGLDVRGDSAPLHIADLICAHLQFLQAFHLLPPRVHIEMFHRFRHWYPWLLLVDTVLVGYHYYRLDAYV